MATVSMVWDTEAQIEGTSDGFTTLSGTTEEFSANVDLLTDGYEGAFVTVEVDFDSTPTDHCDVFIYYGRNSSNYDDTPSGSFRLDKATDPNQVSFLVQKVPCFRIGVKQTGSTNSHDVRIYSRRWRWSSV